MKILFIAAFCFLTSGCISPKKNSESWCEQHVRPEFSAFREITTSSNWFKVYLVGDGIYAIAEPYNFQEVISYLIVGSEKNILLDTGMGMERISEVVQGLSALPVIVINSHTHYDHIGGNNEFDTVYAVDTPYTKHFSTQGWPHPLVKQEVTPQAWCMDKLPAFDTTNYSIKPYRDKIKRFIKDGDLIELGNRTIEVLLVPGHTPDCVALLDRSAGALWSGDMFYEATIWLFFDGTDLTAYEKSINRFALLASDLNVVFTAHNKPNADPHHLTDLKIAFDSVRNGLKGGIINDSKNHPDDKRALIFKFEHFSFLIREEFLNK